LRVVISAATGLIGSALAASLERDGIEVTRLVRRPPRSATEVRWDPTAPAGGLEPSVLNRTDAVVHLSGAPVAGGRWTDARKRELRASRIGSTTALVQALKVAPVPPPVLLCGSAIGFYGNTGAREVDESAPAEHGFLPDLVRDWEAAAAPASDAGVRVVNLRSGIVLSAKGGMLGPLLPLFRLGLGSRLGPGDQYLTWIALADHVRATRFLLDAPTPDRPVAAGPVAAGPGTGGAGGAGADSSESSGSGASGGGAGGAAIDGTTASGHTVSGTALTGPVNVTAPTPVTNAEFTTALASALGRPALLRVPSVLLRTALGELSSELLGSARVIPAQLERAGFSFTYPTIDTALNAELRSAR
jgi:uncharacterized protein (TIGR01777 family)